MDTIIAQKTRSGQSGNYTKKLTLISDAWHPQVNGVVRSIENTNAELDKMGVQITMITPDMFRSVPMPTYPEIRLALASYGHVARLIEASTPDYVHIATEGPLGFKARKWCLKNGMPFTTSYHTRFPEYVSARAPIPKDWLYKFVRNFHNSGNGCMVATDSLEQELRERGIKNLMRWGRGIDAEHFHPQPQEEKPFGLERPIFLTVARVAVEKNLPAFLELDLPGSKVLVGDGPARKALEEKYPDTYFAGQLSNGKLAAAYAQADVFVFTSKTDTFGNTTIEALASGVPVAAFPVTGPRDILDGHEEAGALDEDLKAACLKALDCSREKARALAEEFSWEAAARQFYDNMIEAHDRPSERS
ncbi:glycosyltransferase involved in cell wall biosynthesis [Martelella mediterranea]|uniref:Glycosyltransferase involved in cell wall biosynthesis n=1 Tax=Martelella mediterranea TaxID=293089 RepID=A0A4R3NWJ1_9HYPH|nr:glycosyltransferase family 1 protein [Martelella mediterranea]TCT42164.1 glycosyltransferase involved in cell wall biosynthesis [Martelella mediterranea]